MFSTGDYQWALSTSNDNDHKLYLNRDPNSCCTDKCCFANNYPVLLNGWQANSDLQPVHEYYKAVLNIQVNFAKTESKTSEALKQAVHEIKHQNPSQVKLCKT